MKLRSVRQLKNLSGKHVLVRVDYNVPVHQGRVMETERIERSKDTVRLLLRKGAKVILATHLGRPEGKRIKAHSLKPLVPAVRSIMGAVVRFVPDCIGKKVEVAVRESKKNEIVLLENVRFYNEETDDNPVFAQQLASLAELFVNEAFSNCHRGHASVHAVTRLLPSYAGINLEAEVSALSKVLTGFKRPSVAVIGGAKISTKIGLLESLARRHSKVLLGGALAHAFLIAKGYPLGASFVEVGGLVVAKKLLKKHSSKLILPIDFTILDKRGDYKIVSVRALKKNKGFQIVDIGPKTSGLFDSYVRKAKTVIWNGPLGRAESIHASRGTDAMASSVAQATSRGAYSVVGGGETIAALKKSGLEKKISFVSTAGGAMLEFLEGKELPGIEPLRINKS